MKRLLTAVFLVALVLVSGPAFAAIATGTINVSATVVTACTLAVGNMTFGNYATADTNPLDGTSTVTVTCGAGVPYSIDANGGSYYSAPDRRMFDGTAAYLQYNLYKDTSHLQLWGAAIGGTAMDLLSGSGSPQFYTVYGRIPSGQAAALGSYSDSVQVTVNY